MRRYFARWGGGGAKRRRSGPARRSRLRLETLEPRRLLTATTAVQSGEWDSASTWSNGVPDETLRAIIPSAVTVTLTGDDHTARELVVQGVLDVAESPGVTKTLTSDWIHVNSGGVFQIGTEADRYDENDFVVTLTGDDPTEVFQIEGLGTLTNNNGFLMVASGGRLQFFGQEKLTYTRLAETAEVGSSQILVEAAIDRDFDGDIDADDGSLNWEVGDQIVVASSSQDYRDEEVRTVQAIADQGDGSFLITLDAALQERHYGEIETYGNLQPQEGDFSGDGVVSAADFTVLRDLQGGAAEHDEFARNFGESNQDDGRTWDVDLRAEVAILSRNVRIQGEASHDTDNAFGDRARFSQTPGAGDGFGGHTMIMATAGQITIDSVQFDRLGQTGRLGRYPIHWHVAGDRTGDILRGSSITNSNNRGVTVHNTRNLLIEDNVLHDIHGHGFFMEDAVETGNEFLGNIALGIHKVGRNDSNQFAPDLSDPFIVDTHDHVGQNGNRFLSSAAYWITNPDNTWVGNISAGSEGTGFWFILPDRPIGSAAGDPQFSGVRPDRTNLRQFDHNSSHSSPIGINFDRGSDIEVPVGGNLKPFFDGDQWLPPQEPQINYFTAYKHRVGNYHRGQQANFHENRYVDNFTSTFLTFTQRVTDTLYVGHSRGNADPGAIVTGHTIYDGASTLTGNHFAGFAASNAHTFRTHNAANRFTSYLVSGATFEDDGSAGSVSIASQNGTLNGGGAFSRHGPFLHSPSAILDVDGSLTGHVGGGPGRTVVVDHPFFYDADDLRPDGWGAVVSEDSYAQVRVQPTGGNPAFRFTTPDGDSGTERQASGFNTHVKTDQPFGVDYTVSFPDGAGSVNGGFNFKHFQRVGPNDGSTIFRFVGIGQTMAPQGVPNLGSESAVRNASFTSFARVGNDLIVKFFSSSQDVRFRFDPGPGLPGPEVLWSDAAPLSGVSQSGGGLIVNTVDGAAATGDGSRGDVARLTLGSGSRFQNIFPETLPIDPQHRGTTYTFTVDYFVPNGTTLSGPDVFYLQLDFNGVNTDSAGFTNSSAAGTGWQTLTLTDTVPGNANNAQPFFIIADGGIGNGSQPSGNGSGTALFIDNITFTVGQSSSPVTAGLAAPAIAPALSVAPRPVTGQSVTGRSAAPANRNDAADTLAIDLRVRELALAAVLRDDPDTGAGATITDAALPEPEPEPAEGGGSNAPTEAQLVDLAVELHPRFL